MKPYLAVLYDSFLEATRSKVLWVLLIGWILILIGIAPFGFIHERSYRFTGSDVLARQSLADQLRAACQGQGTAPQRAVAGALDPPTAESFKQATQTDGRRFLSGRLAEVLNEAIDAPDLYNADAWPKADRRSDIRELLAIDPSKRSQDDVEHLNRRLIEQAFPSNLKPVNENRVWIGYAGFKIGGELPISPAKFKQFVETFFLIGIMKFGLGIIAIFVAVIVTSPMIPDMFQAGSLHLLLSKPISRALLFLTKFAGGCVFVAINIAFLLTGLYFVVGIRLGIWNAGLLLCIPIFVFVFMIFYSVSALAGLIWKNAIVSVVVTTIFWALCTVLGLFQGIMKPFITVFPEIASIVLVEDKVFTTTQGSAINLWLPDKSIWQEAFDSNRNGNVKNLGPFWFRQHGELYYGRAFQTPFGMNTDEIRMVYADLSELKAGSASSDEDEVETKEGKKRDLWSDSRTDSLGNFPTRTRRALPWRESLMVLGDRGLFYFDRSVARKGKAATSVIENFAKNAFDRILGGTKSEQFPQMTSEAWQPQPPMDLAIVDPTQVLIYNRGHLHRLTEITPNKFELQEDTEVSTKEDTLALLSATSSGCLLAKQNQVPEYRPLEALATAHALDEIGAITPRSVILSPRGDRFALLTSKGRVWIVSSDGKSVQMPRLTGQDRATAIAWDELGHLWVGHHVNQLDSWDIDASTSQPRARPNMRTVDRIFHWIVNPIYLVNPKPAAVDETIAYVLQRDDDLGIEVDTSDLTNAQAKIDPWQPLWSNSLFIVVVLAISCIYLYRQDL